MSSDEIEQKEEELPKEEIPVPLYFDRYVVSEIRALGVRIVDLKESMDECFAQVDKRFVDFDRRFVDLKESMDERFVQFEKRIDERFIQIDRRFADLKESMEGRFTQVDRRMDERFAQVDKRFVDFDRRFVDLKESMDDKLDSTIKWAIGLFLPVIVGILALIVRVFFFGP